MCHVPSSSGALFLVLMSLQALLSLNHSSLHDLERTVFHRTSTVTLHTQASLSKVLAVASIASPVAVIAVVQPSTKPSCRATLYQTSTGMLAIMQVEFQLLRTAIMNTARKSSQACYIRQLKMHTGDCSWELHRLLCRGSYRMHCLVLHA